MVTIAIDYDGELRCRARHAPSGATLLTDAPRDNQGLGRSFSPTDLLATAVGTCMLTIMALAARRESISLAGARCTVDKEMSALPRRRIGRLVVELHVPVDPGPAGRALLQAAAAGCPVSASLSSDTEVVVRWSWGDSAAQ